MEARNFLTTNLSPSMIEKLPGHDLSIESNSLKVDDIKDIEFISALKSQPLVNYLQKRGISSATLGYDVKISLQEGDCLYIVNPNVNLHEINGDTLPPHASITITKACVKKTI